MHYELLRLGPLTIYSYGFMVAIGFLSAVWLGSKRAPKLGLDKEIFLNLALVVIVFGYVGSKTLFLVTELPSLIRNPALIWSSLRNGFVMYGGFIGGILSGFIYCKMKKSSFLAYFDLLAPSLVLAQGIGRLGCYLAGCCYGKDAPEWIGIHFPQGSLAPSYGPIYPTQLLMSAGDILIMFALLLIARKKKANGEVGAWYMILYSIGRFLVEFLRGDNRGTVGALSTSQFIAVFVFAGGIALLILSRKRNKPDLVNETPKAVS